MFIFILLITIIIVSILGYFTFKLNNTLNLENKPEEILFTWFLSLALVILIRTVANLVLHYEITHQIGSKGIKGLRGSKGFQGDDSECF
tara:strand:- start:752 stop:1018 length:267 start_codon:yes stop_codon:yes gene_type:complete